MFSCRVCASKSSQIETLLEEIKFLRTLVSPETPHRSHLIDLEANRILDGAAMPIIEVADAESQRYKAAEKLQQEADSILSGTY